MKHRQMKRDPWLDRKTAAHRMRRSPGTLAVWDCRGTYDLKPCKKKGIKVFYRRSVIDAIRRSWMTP